jgi:hypothetical protein
MACGVLHEITSFPKGKYNDQCDSTSQALSWVKSGSAHNGFFKWLELEAEKAKKERSALVMCPALSGMPEQIGIGHWSATSLP